MLALSELFLKMIIELGNMFSFFYVSVFFDFNYFYIMLFGIQVHAKVIEPRVPGNK